MSLQSFEKPEWPSGMYIPSPGGTRQDSDFCFQLSFCEQYPFHRLLGGTFSVYSGGGLAV